MTQNMHSRFLMFIWRKKLLLFVAPLIFLLAIWIWVFVYTSNRNHVDSNKNSVVRTKHLKLLQKLGLNGRETVFPDQQHVVQYVKPSAINIYSLNQKEKYFKKWQKILQDKNGDSFDPESQNDISRRRVAEEMKIAADKQTKYENQLKKMGLPVLVGLGPSNKHEPPHNRLVHFDFKGGALRIGYLLKILPMLKSLGATGIILEYEDMFPYSGYLSPMAAKNAYSKKDILQILQTAHLLGLEVIPLVQTFGHLEFALKLKEFYHLREVQDATQAPQAICPSLNSSMAFINELLNQVISLHSLNPDEQNRILAETKFDDVKMIPALKSIHIGCDEVFQLGECSRCRDKAHDKIFLDHVVTVASLIKKRRTYINVIIWDDQLRQMPIEAIKHSGIGPDLVQPMIWVYAEDIYKFIQSSVWDKYSQVFSTAWVAGAFKGAFGETLLVPPGRRHLENTLRWLAIIQGEGIRFKNGIKGIALTGWQRYDHFATLCELFPVAIPSLAMQLHTVSRGYFDVDSKTNPIIPSLSCPQAPGDRYLWLDLNKDPDLYSFTRCIFPGSSVFRYINRLSSLVTETREFINTLKYSRGFLSDYNIRYNFTSASRISELLEDEPRLQASLVNIAKSIVENMEEIYDSWTVTEFIEQQIFPLINELKHYELIGESLRTRKVFPARPLKSNIDKSLKELGIVINQD